MNLFVFGDGLIAKIGVIRMWWYIGFFVNVVVVWIEVWIWMNKFKFCLICDGLIDMYWYGFVNRCVVKINIGNVCLIVLLYCGFGGSIGNI